MEGIYGVHFGNHPVGKVSVRKQGLYYRFSCRCQLTEGFVCRLRVSCEDRQENLGILVPMDGGFGLETRLPVKRLGEGVPDFTLVPKHESGSGTFVPVYPEEPFAYISRLKKAYLARRDGKLGIVLE